MEKEMDEGRKRTIGVIVAIFACRKLAALKASLHQRERWRFETALIWPWK